MPVLTPHPLLPLDAPHEEGFAVINGDGSQHCFVLRWDADKWFRAAQAPVDWQKQGLLTEKATMGMVSVVMDQAIADGQIGTPPQPGGFLSKFFGGR